jgi:hypothetical protein
VTDSVCWIDTRKDAELSVCLRKLNPSVELDEGHEIRLGSSTWTNTLWINRLEDWAESHSLPIEYPDLSWIVKQVSVNRTQLLQFLDENGCGSIGAADAIRACIQERGDEEFVYRILADDY